jgi:prepilin-type N-terminal cleavage/methylation domain-containing protein
MIQVKLADTDSGWTLVELMTVVAIIGLLSAISMFSYKHFIQKARAVEADMALAEVTRLEELYFSATGTYSADLEAIGFKPNPALQYYQVSVQAVNGPDGSMFHVTAHPRSDTEAGQARSVTRYADNQAGEKKSGAGGVSVGQARISTATSAGSTGSGASIGGEGNDDLKVNDDLSERMGRSFSSAQQGGKTVQTGKATGPPVGTR